MDKRTAGIIGLIVSILCCGLPGLCMLCMGPMYTIIGMTPGSEIDIFGSSDPSAAIAFGIGLLCFSLILIAIPVLIWYFTLREKTPPDDIVKFDEPIPEEDL